MSRYLPLICLALLHTLVDACQFLVEPLWGQLKGTLKFSEWAFFFVLTAQALSPSISQAVFGILRDQFSARYLLWLGPVVAAGCLSIIGFASDASILGLLLIVGGVGVGAFHPEAAVTAGRLLPEHRARAISIFLFGGTLGLGLGPILSGLVVGRFGIQSLAWLGLPIIVVVLLLYQVAVRSDRDAISSAVPTQQLRLGEFVRTQGAWALYLWVVCSFRLVPNMAMTKVLALTLTQRGHAPEMIGFVQALFLVSGGLGMLMVAYRFRAGWEKSFMIWCPIVGLPTIYILAIESAPLGLLLSMLMLSGLLLWGTTPVMVSYAHQLFPRATGLASAITMGLAWGLAGLIQAKITSLYDAQGIPQQAFIAFIPCLVLAAVGSCFLPSLSQPDEQTATEETVTAEANPEPADA